VSKTSTKASPAKAVSKDPVPDLPTAVVAVSSAKTASNVRLSEQEKLTDPNYILNPNTNKSVKRSTPLGERIVEAMKTGKEIPKAMTETDKHILVAQTIKNAQGLSDAELKEIYTPIIDVLPRGFPVVWGGKQRTVKDKNKPKQPSNAYIYYTLAVRNSVESAHPGIKNTELVRMMADMWGKTSDKDKDEYLEAAAKDKARYLIEKKAYDLKYPEQVKTKKSKSKSGRPTKFSAYNKFCETLDREALKRENPDEEINVIISDQWEVVKADKEEHAKYQALADKANEGFKERLADCIKGGRLELSEAEQKKANDPEHFVMNPDTGYYIEKKVKAVPKVNAKAAAVEVEAEGEIDMTTEVETPKSPVKTKASKAKRATKAAKAKAESVKKAVDEDDDLLDAV